MTTESNRPEGSTFVFSANRDFELLATNQLDAGFMASPAVCGKDFVLRTKTDLYRIAGNGGEMIRP